MKILVVEDDAMTRDYVVAGLDKIGHLVVAAQNGDDGLALALQGGHDAIVLDRMLPGKDGLAILQTLRAAKITTPVLFLTAVSAVDDRVEGLEAGADDYLVKPFAISELAARIAAIGRRPAAGGEPTVLRIGDLEMDLLNRVVSRRGEIVKLLPKEYALLEYLMKNEGRTLSRKMLLERVWDFNFDPKTTVVETHVSRLRAKIDRPFDVPMIETIKNVGYRLHAPG